MNHPLRLDGWRLFQSRFGDDGARRSSRSTAIPGSSITYPACAVVLLGLIVVFFMKKTLLLVRRRLEREGATPTRRTSLYAVAAVAAVGIGPAIFSVYVAARPWAEQRARIVLPLSGWPAFVFGLSLVALFPIMVVVGSRASRCTRGSRPRGRAAASERAHELSARSSPALAHARARRPGHRSRPREARPDRDPAAARALGHAVPSRSSPTRARSSSR